jgi:hypothetical protein
MIRETTIKYDYPIVANCSPPSKFGVRAAAGVNMDLTQKEILE